MKFLKQWLLAAAALAAGAAAFAQVTVSGVKYDETADVRGSKLQLNGAGVRYKAVFKVYTAGLYLAKKAGTHRGGAGRARRQAHVHHHAARDRLQPSWASCSRAAWRTTWTRRPSPS